MCFLFLHLSGEVPGLYSPEELEPLLSPLKDAASQDGFTGPLYNYFSFSQSRVPLDWPLCVSAILFFARLSLFSWGESSSALIIASASLQFYCIMRCESTAVLASLSLLPVNQIKRPLILKLNPSQVLCWTAAVTDRQCFLFACLPFNSALFVHSPALVDTPQESSRTSTLFSSWTAPAPPLPSTARATLHSTASVPSSGWKDGLRAAWRRSVLKEELNRKKNI